MDIEEDDSIKIDIQKSLEFSNSPVNIKNSSSKSKTPVDIFNLSKLYYKYLNSVNVKLRSSSDTTTEFIENRKKFMEYYTNATLIYEDIKKNWFWLENGEKLKYFTRNATLLESEQMLQSEMDIENRKINLMNNQNMLECIAKLYGYDSWLSNQKNMCRTN